MNILAVFKHLPFLPKIAKHDVTKVQFSQKFIDGFFWNLCGRCQIDAGEGTESFASISAAVFFFSCRENPAGGRHCPPPRGVRVNRLFIWFPLRLTIFSPDSVLIRDTSDRTKNDMQFGSSSLYRTFQRVKRHTQSLFLKRSLKTYIEMQIGDRKRNYD